MWVERRWEECPPTTVYLSPPPLRTYTQLPTHWEGAWYRGSDASLSANLCSDSGCLHLPLASIWIIFSPNDCHSHNYNNYSSSNTILNGLRIFLLRMLMCSGWGERRGGPAQIQLATRQLLVTQKGSRREGHDSGLGA